MRRGTALVMLARASEDLLVAQQVLEDIQQMVTLLEPDEVVRDAYITDIRDRAAVMRLLAEGAQL